LNLGITTPSAATEKWGPFCLKEWGRRERNNFAKQISVIVPPETAVQPLRPAPNTLLLALMLSPALFLSNILGSSAFHGLGDHHYRPIALGLLTIIALVTLGQALI
jgi:hypothetical protein